MADIRSGSDADDALFAVWPPFVFDTGAGARNSASRGYAPSAATVAWPLKRMRTFGNFGRQPEGMEVEIADVAVDVPSQ